MNCHPHQTHVSDCKEKGMCLDDLPLAVEGDISILSVVPELRQLGDQVGAVEAHPVCILEGF